MKEFLIPEYFTEFKCKTGECRFSCCEGWQVTLSVDDYFKLSSAECSKELREKIDRGVKVFLHPTPSAYAYIQHDYEGNCPMRLPDGRCAIHAEIGEYALAKVCKLYPRGIRKEPWLECSCANSCEATLELLFSKDEPIRFIKKALDLEIPVGTERTVIFDTQGKEWEIRSWLINILQDREYSLTVRLATLGLALRDLKDVLDSKDVGKINALIEKPYDVRPSDLSFQFSSKRSDGDAITLAVDKTHLAFGLSVMRKLLTLIDEKSDSVRFYGEKALSFFGGGEDCFNKYEQAKFEFENKIPKWEIWFEHMLVNHVFFEQFPFQDRPEGPWEEFVAICSVYALLRFLGIGWMANKSEPSDFVDMSAAVFRLVDHTSFDRYSARVLKDLSCDTPQKIFALIAL